MKKHCIANRLSRLLLLASLLPAVSYATNGLFLIGNGSQSRAMGGVGIGLPLDSLSAVANPAAISGMEDRFDISMDMFVPHIQSQLGSVSDRSVGQVNGMNIKSLYFMPAMAITYQYNDKITLGFAMSSTGGGGTKFKKNFFEAANAGTANAPSVNTNLGVDYLVMEMAPTVAYKVNDKNSVAASLVIGVARFEAYGLGLFSTFTPSNTGDFLTNQGKEWSTGAGVRVGWMGDFGKYKLGAEYTSKVFMRKFHKYSELFAEGGRMNVPASLGFGMSVQAKPKLTLALDFTRTFYSETPAISNLGPNLAGNPAGPTQYGTRQLGTSDGLGFGWTNQNVIKIGAAYQYSEKTTLRAGWNYGESPINGSREIIFNLLAPATVQNHLTLGGTYKLNKTMEVSASYIHAFRHKQSGPTYISDNGSNYGSLQMSQDAVGGMFSMKY